MKQNDLIRSGALTLAADPREPYVAPEPEVPYLNFAPLQNASARLELAAAAIDKIDAPKLSPEKQRAVEEALRAAPG